MPDRTPLDAGPLGRLCRPNARPAPNREIAIWFTEILRSGEVELVVPEISDFEVRRELIRAGLTQSVSRLDALKNDLLYLPLDTPTLHRAAELWAEARNRGIPTGDPRELDCDVILAAQAERIGRTIVTENVGHLSRFLTTRHWRDLASP
ncbi:MAG: type II toxin-antitoxin system VapC family toxin [Armatimonadota bacterium]